MKNFAPLKNQPSGSEKVNNGTLPAFQTEQGHVTEIPAEGSLGLLALGYVGLMAWRNVRRRNSSTSL
jgi:hypothetical protein